MFLRAWGTAQHPALGDAWAAGCDRGAQDRRDPGRGLQGRHRICPPATGTAVVDDAVAARGRDDRPAADPARARHPDRVEPGRGGEAPGRRTGPARGRTRPGPRCDGPPDRLPARRRGDRGVHRDRRPGRARRPRRRHPHRRPAAGGRVQRRVHRDPGPPDHPRRHPAADPARATRRAPALRRRDHPARPGRRPRVPRAPTGRSRRRSPASSPKTPPGARVLTDPNTGQVCSVGTDVLPAGRGPDPHHPSPGRDLHLPRLPTTRHPLRDRPPHPLRPPPTTHPSAAPHAGAQPTLRPVSTGTTRRPARRTCTPCASTTTKPRPKAGGTSPTTPTTGVSTWTDRHGLTYARHPIPVYVSAQRARTPTTTTATRGPRRPTLRDRSGRPTLLTRPFGDHLLTTSVARAPPSDTPPAAQPSAAASAASPSRTPSDARRAALSANGGLPARFTTRHAAVGARFAAQEPSKARSHRAHQARMLELGSHSLPDPASTEVSPSRRDGRLKRARPDAAVVDPRGPPRRTAVGDGLNAAAGLTEEGCDGRGGVVMDVSGTGEDSPMSSAAPSTRGWIGPYLLLAALWGCSFLFIATALQTFAPTQVAFGRIVVGFAMLGADPAGQARAGQGRAAADRGLRHRRRGDDGDPVRALRARRAAGQLGARRARQRDDSPVHGGVRRRSCCRPSGRTGCRSAAWSSGSAASRCCSGCGTRARSTWSAG